MHELLYIKDEKRKNETIDFGVIVNIKYIERLMLCLYIYIYIYIFFNGLYQIYLYVQI